MREFTDAQGAVWTATVRERTGPDYKGRYYFWVERRDGGEGVPLLDVRWNSEPTAARTLATMSEVELRRRLRSAIGRTAPAGETVPEGA
ncbi:MAG: hypothetical protein EXR95_06875 [Gemmatimonadetes bacterium]|nr:hypothetical protein [Gemmatimonadota bacterium]